MFIICKQITVNGITACVVASWGLQRFPNMLYFLTMSMFFCRIEHTTEDERTQKK